jgi:hypothetical protein
LARDCCFLAHDAAVAEACRSDYAALRARGVQI